MIVRALLVTSTLALVACTKDTELTRPDKVCIDPNAKTEWSMVGRMNVSHFICHQYELRCPKPLDVVVDFDNGGVKCGLLKE